MGINSYNCQGGVKMQVDGTKKPHDHCIEKKKNSSAALLMGGNKARLRE